MQLMNKKYFVISILFASTAALVFLLMQFRLLDSWQEKIFDRFFTKKPVSGQIVIFAIDHESIAALGQWPWPRSVFSSAVEKLQSASAIGLDVNFSEPSAAGAAGDELLAAAISRSVPPVILPLQIDAATGEVTEPLEVFKQKAVLGHAHIVNEDGMARNVRHVQSGFASFSARAAMAVRPGIAIPDVMRIDYAGPEKTFTTLPIADLINNRVPESVYRGRVALIGATAPDLHDTLQTPFGLLSGVAIHASAIETLLSQKFYTRLGIWLSFSLILAVSAAAAVLIVRAKKLLVLMAGLAALLVAVNAVSLVLFSYKVLFDALYANIALILVSAACISYQYVSESAEKRFIFNSFKYYLSPEVIGEIMRHPEQLKLGGEKKKITVFFSDIRGFSGMSEKLSPEMLTYVVSEYMTEMTDIIMGQRGLVAQYFGDGIMAFWGAPVANERQAADACSAALMMIPALERLNARFASEGIGVSLAIGVGIHTGLVTAGNIGSRKKFNYTVFGDGVNLASRLEGLNKEYGTNIIISESVKRELEGSGGIVLRELDTIIVKGRSEPTTIFEILPKPLYKDIERQFASAREHYRRGQWQEAIEAFAPIAAQDGPSRLLMERSRMFQENPPSGWNGIYAFKSK